MGFNSPSLKRPKMFIICLFLSINFWNEYSIYSPNLYANSPFWGIGIEFPVKKFYIGNSIMTRFFETSSKVKTKILRDTILKDTFTLHSFWNFEYIILFEISKKFFNEKIELSIGGGNFIYKFPTEYYPPVIKNFFFVTPFSLHIQHKFQNTPIVLGITYKFCTFIKGKGKTPPYPFFNLILLKWGFSL